MAEPHSRLRGLANISNYRLQKYLDRAQRPEAWILARGNMKSDTKDGRVISATTADRSFGSVVRRFFARWKRLEEALDYSAQDYALDRVKALELRVLQLENTRSVAAQLPPSSLQPEGDRL
jgi:hypothetical protein